MNDSEMLTMAIDDCKQLAERIAEIKNKSDSTETFFMDSILHIKRYDHLRKFIDDQLDLNKIRSFNYPFTISVQNSIHEIFMPATNASSYISGINRSLRALYPKANVFLANVLRGSTILCFDFSEDNYFDTKFNRIETAQQLGEFCSALEESEDDARKGIESVVKVKTKRESLLRSIKSLTPVIGDTENTTVIEMDSIVTPIKLDSGIRETINFLSPSKSKKNPQVDWDNLQADGFIREINNVSKSFILYSNINSDDQADALIKIYYQEESIEELLLKKFANRVRVRFRKENRRCFVEGIDPVKN